MVSLNEVPPVLRSATTLKDAIAARILSTMSNSSIYPSLIKLLAHGLHKSVMASIGNLLAPDLVKFSV